MVEVTRRSGVEEISCGQERLSGVKVVRGGQERSGQEKRSRKGRGVKVMVRREGQ